MVTITQFVGSQISIFIKNGVTDGTIKKVKKIFDKTEKDSWSIGHYCTIEFDDEFCSLDLTKIQKPAKYDTNEKYFYGYPEVAIEMVVLFLKNLQKVYKDSGLNFTNDVESLPFSCCTGSGLVNGVVSYDYKSFKVITIDKNFQAEVRTEIKIL